MNSIIKIFQENQTRPFNKILNLLNHDQIELLKIEFNHQNPEACIHALKQRLLGFEISLRCPICNKEIQKTQYAKMSINTNISKRTCGNKECKVQYKKQCVFEKYGVDSIAKLDSVKEAKQKTNQERYGGNAPACNQDVLNKMKSTNLERYGNENFRNTDEYLKKSNRTCQERYGVDLNEVQSQEWFRNKVKSTNLEKYGVESVLQSDEIKNKIKQTNLEKYGVEWFTQVPEFQEYVKQANLEKLGVEYTMQSPEIKEKIKQTNLEKYGVEWLFQAKEFKENLKIIISEKYPDGLPNVYISSIHQEIIDFIKSNFLNKVSINNRSVLNGKELDIYISELKLGIEVNGDYWHSSIKKEQGYHLNKTLLAESKGIRLIHIWEHEWLQNKEFIKTLLTLYLENKVYQNEFQKLLEQFNNRLPRDYFSVLDFPGEIELPQEEMINDHIIEKTGYILNNEKYNATSN